jgi:hypothetical protein
MVRRTVCDLDEPRKKVEGTVKTALTQTTAGRK